MPSTPPSLPDAVVGAHAGWTWSLAYTYENRTATYRLERAGTARFCKVAPLDWEPPLADEADRMEWARAHLPVPVVLDQGSTMATQYLLTAALPGVDATDPVLRADPGRLVQILARGLRAFHDAPVEMCPFDFRLDLAFAHVRRRAAAGAITRSDLHPEHLHLGVDGAVARLEELRPAGEDLVVCHGDYCLPNALVQGDRVTGFVDLGELGVADRWWDLAVATWSLDWNLGPGWDGPFYAAYGVEPDPGRIAFYRLLYDLVS